MAVLRTAGMTMAWQSHFLAELGLNHVGLSAPVRGSSLTVVFGPYGLVRHGNGMVVPRIAFMATTWQGHLLAEP